MALTLHQVDRESPHRIAVAHLSFARIQSAWIGTSWQGDRLKCYNCGRTVLRTPDRALVLNTHCERLTGTTRDRYLDFLDPKNPRNIPSQCPALPKQTQAPCRIPRRIDARSRRTASRIPAGEGDCVTAVECRGPGVTLLTPHSEPVDSTSRGYFCGPQAPRNGFKPRLTAAIDARSSCCRGWKRMVVIAIAKSGTWCPFGVCDTRPPARNQGNRQNSWCPFGLLSRLDLSRNLPCINRLE